MREIVLYWKRTLKRLDVTSRSLIALVEPGSCFAGTLLELALAADRILHAGRRVRGREPAAALQLTAMNFGPYPMGNGLTRLASALPRRRPSTSTTCKDEIGKALDAEAADELGLVTFTPDDIDWEDEVRLAIEERAGFSPDALTGMEANLRFAGPETMETKIFARLSAWQNWIFQRPNAVGARGRAEALRHGQASQVRPRERSCEENTMAIDYTQRIPNNVDLPSDRRLQRALEHWQPRLPRLVEGHGARAASRPTTSTCAPPSASTPRAGRTSAT